MVSEKRLKKLSNPEYREEYLRSTVTAWVVHQLKALREARGWTQADLGERADMSQSAIGRIESESYGHWNSNTLLKLANAFDVALEIRFVSWPSFIRNTTDTSPETMHVPSFAASDFSVGPATYQRFAKEQSEQQTVRPSGSALLSMWAYRQPFPEKREGLH